MPHSIVWWLCPTHEISSNGILLFIIFLKVLYLLFRNSVENYFMLNFIIVLIYIYICVCVCVWKIGKKMRYSYFLKWSSTESCWHKNKQKFMWIIFFIYLLRTFCPHLDGFCVVSSFTKFRPNFTCGLLQVIYRDLG